MARNIDQILRDIRKLEQLGFEVEHNQNFSWVHVKNLELPRGKWTSENGLLLKEISVLVQIPPDWPLHPPGVGLSHPSFAIHIPYLAYNGRKIRDLHKCQHYPWYWMCFEEIYWKSEYGLIGLLQIIEKSIWERGRK